MPSQSQDALTMLLMQSLTKQGGGMTPGADPFAPEPGASAGRRDPFSQEQALAGGSAVDRLAEGLGVDASELQQPASGPMATALGVEGVEPDFDQAEKLIKYMQMAKQLGIQEALGQGAAPGGPPPADPTTRGALTYQAIQNSVNQFGPGHFGGQILNSLSPLMAPYLMGPALERQRAEAARAAQIKQIAALEETRQLGAKRQAETELAIARTRKLEEETKLLGGTEYQLKGTPKSGGFIFNPKTGEVRTIEPAPDGKTLLPPKPFEAIDPKDGNKYRYWYRNYEDMWAGIEPARKDLVQPAGTSEERRSLAESYTLAEKLIPEIQAIHEKTNGRLVGPHLGRLLEDRKTGGEGFLGKRIGQMIGKAATDAYLSDEDLQLALDLQFKVETLNQALNRLYTGLAYNDTEYQQRKNSMGIMTDYSLDFGKAIKQQGDYLREARKRREKLLGIEDPNAGLTLDDILNKRTASSSPATGFSGAPTTKVPGQLQHNLDKQMADELSRDLGF